MFNPEYNNKAQTHTINIPSGDFHSVSFDEDVLIYICQGIKKLNTFALSLYRSNKLTFGS